MPFKSVTFDFFKEENVKVDLVINVLSVRSQAHN